MKIFRIKIYLKIKIFIKAIFQYKINLKKIDNIILKQSNKNFLTYGDYKVKCAIGKRGIGKKQKEGDQITPRGTFRIESILYRKDKINYLRSVIKKTQIKKNMGWCDDPKSKDYNKLIKYPFNYKSEKLYRSNNIYDIILVLDFNMHPIKKK